MIVTERQVKSLKLAICVSSVQMDAAVVGHEVESLVHDGQCLLVPLLLEQGRSHVIISEPNLHRHFVLEPLAVHELGAAFQITQCLVVVMSFPMD